MSSSNIFIQPRGSELLPKFSATTLLNADHALQRRGGKQLVRDEILSYLVPEQYYGDDLTRYSDQYALGLVAFEMLEGRPPIKVRCLADLETTRRFFDEPERFGGEWINRYPQFSEIVLRMLSKNQAERFSGMAEIENAIAKLHDDSYTEKALLRRARDIYETHCRYKPEFFELFYQRFFSKCSDVKRMFDPERMDDQYRMLDDAILRMLEYSDKGDPNILEFAAKSHRKRKLTADHFENFAIALAETLAETLHKAGGTDKDVCGAWTAAVTPAFDYMKQHCAQASVTPNARAEPHSGVDSPRHEAYEGALAEPRA